MIYDHACGLHRYVLNREPTQFRHVEFFVDGSHWGAHKQTKKHRITGRVVVTWGVGEVITGIHIKTLHLRRSEHVTVSRVSRCTLVWTSVAKVFSKKIIKIIAVI